jgi:hypothetical protein
VKIARTVLRGGSGSNATSLPDHLTYRQVKQALARSLFTAKTWKIMTEKHPTNPQEYKDFGYP